METIYLVGMIGAACVGVGLALFGVALARAAAIPFPEPLEDCGPREGGGWGCQPWKCSRPAECPLGEL